MTGEFAGRAVAVTGAAHGIGRAIAMAFAAGGADLALFDIDAEALGETAATLRAKGGRVLEVPGDLLDPERVVAGFAEAAEALGPVDILVNNLGQTARENYSDFCEARVETLDFVLAISLRAALHCARRVVPGMRDRGWGRVISISSDAALNGDAGCVDYAAAKAGILGFTRALAREMAPHGVTANAVCPGATRTRAMERIPPEAYERARRAIPMGALCEPEDIANAVIFLASDRARFITGQTLLVNGGRVFH
ncbi:MAG: short-chain dehydrogenase [Rhodovulum sulfidophilum]|uniref:Short-chain dehydrogenase n=1 Tax=Rhodovulum sulfidophilum TaxID=35806 RepID=A0A2W5PP16_RHOSU|nr:MAG: short-chain dehydrogenase [Rhodovulum sulfidophilum]